MTTPTDIIAGTITLTNGSTAIVGVGTSWSEDDIRGGDSFVFIEGGDGFQLPIINEITDNLNGTIVEPWSGPTLTGVRYRIRFQWDSARVSAKTRAMIQKLDNGNIEALAALTGPGVGVFNGPHSMIIKPETDFINGVAFNVQVDTLADRAAYDGQSAGFTVLVADIGDGRSAVYSKNSNTSGDWSDPAIITGPEGDMPNLVIQPTVTGAPGTDADVDFDPISGGYNVTFTIPAGEGFYWENAYNPALAYAVSSVVRNNGSSFIAAQAVPIGEAPSGLFPPVDTAYWEVLAARGANGTGTGDVVGPPSSTDGAFAGFDGTDGKLLKELSGTVATSMLNLYATALKGLVPGPSSGDVTANRLLRADGTWVDPPSTSGDLEFVLAQVLMKLADLDNQAQFLGPTGNRFADSYDTLTFVDVAGATNLDTSTAGVLKPSTTADTYTTTANPTLTANNAGNSGSTFRQLIPAAVFTVSGDRVRLTLTPPSTGASHIINNMFIGERASVADFVGTPTRVTFGGSNGVTLVAGGSSVVSDAAVFALDETKSYIVSWDNGATADIREDTGIAGGYIAYIKSGVSEAGSVTVSGYSAVNDRVFCIDLVQVRTAVGTTNNLTVQSAAFTAASPPTKMKAMMNVKEVEAAVAGTDYTLECSRDGGANWAAMALTEHYTMPTSGLRVVEAAETDVSAQPSGTAPRYRLKTLNNKNVEFHDTHLYWSA